MVSHRLDPNRLPVTMVTKFSHVANFRMLPWHAFQLTANIYQIWQILIHLRMQINLQHVLKMTAVGTHALSMNAGCVSDALYIALRKDKYAKNKSIKQSTH